MGTFRFVRRMGENDTDPTDRAEEREASEDARTAGRERDEQGRLVEQYPPQDFLEAIKDLGGIAGTGEIYRHVGCDHRTAYKKLSDLADEGILTKRNAGNTMLWSLAETVDDTDQ